MDHQPIPTHVPPEENGYGAVKKKYVFSYFVVICLGIFAYHLLCELISLTVVSGLGSDYKSPYYYAHFVPFYGGLILSAILSCSKNSVLLFANAILCVGAITFSNAYYASFTLSPGICLIHFAGGFIEGLTSVYLFEVSPKEVFAFAGVIGYLATITARFAASFIVCISMWLGATSGTILAISLGCGIAASSLSLFFLPSFGRTPIELYSSALHEECKTELRKLYVTESDAMDRYSDIQKTVGLTDKYSVSIFRLFTFPPLYRNALLVGIAIGFSQGVTSIFFEGFLCNLATNEATMKYCQKQLYNVNGGLKTLLLFNILAVGPIVLYLYKLETWGRAKMFFLGMFSTLVTVVLIQIFSQPSQIGSFFKWQTYVVQSLLTVYTIVVYSGTLGPTYMIYLPEILPLPGVTISILARTGGRAFEYVFRHVGTYSASIMIGVSAVFVMFFWYVVRETRQLNDMQLYVLYLNDEQKTAILSQQALDEKQTKENFQ